MRHFGKLFLSVFLWCFLTLAFADSSPVGIMNKAADEMIAALEKNKTRLSNPKVIYQIVERTLIPYVDIDRMAGSVVGRDQWAKASASEKQTFVREFSKLVISTYAAALASYDGDKIKFYPARGGAGSTATVNSVVVRRNGQRIPINYNLSRKGDGWKVYDFNIENVSMVQSYRSQFSDVLAQGGLAALNQRLIQHNRGRG